jgi:hypothetical protein
MSRRLLGFGLLCVVCAVAGWVYLSGAREAGGQAPVPAALPTATGPDALARIRAAPYLMFRNTDQRQGYGRLALSRLEAPGERYLADLVCERVYFAGGRGLCLKADRGVVTTYGAFLFDDALVAGKEIRLTGAPSRARVSPDGRFAAFTVFENGHSYAGSDFSTRTTIVDLRTAALVAQLEDFTVLRDGEIYHEKDFNFWGVTFAPEGNRFYATLASGGRIHLIEGDLAARQARILREGVECPSLSPDGHRIAFKSRHEKDGRLGWQLHVLDLRTMDERALDGEARSVDDQAEWLDDQNVMYALPEERVPATGGSDVWVMPAEPGRPPHRLIEQAYSPSVVRPLQP